jgi:hypothetical protein
LKKNGRKSIAKACEKHSSDIHFYDGEAEKLFVFQQHQNEMFLNQRILQYLTDVKSRVMIHHRQLLLLVTRFASLCLRQYKRRGRWMGEDVDTDVEARV